MCVYNGEKYLSQAIDSIVNNGFNNYEVIVINDGSTDRSEELLVQYQKKYSQIKVVTKQNTGLTSALNIGLKLSTGEYIARLDVDDLCLPGRLTVQSNYLDSHPDTSLVGCNAILINQYGKKIGVSKVGKLSHEDCVHRLLSMKAFFAHSSWMVRRSGMLAIGGYNGFFKKAQDYDFLLQFSEKYRINCLPEILIALRKDEKSISFDSEFLQYKYGITALLAYEVRSGRFPNLPKDCQGLFEIVSMWFANLKLGPKMLALQFASLARYDFRGGEIIKGIIKLFSAVKAYPLILINIKALKKMRDNTLVGLQAYLTEKR